MTTLLDGQRTWIGERDEEGHRTYGITFLVKGTKFDGPANALGTPGLPLPGAPWVFDNDVDLYAWCRPTARVTPLVENEPNTYFEVEMTFSSKPPDRNKQRCYDVQIEDPILEPQKVSGGFSRFSEEATHDRFGRPIINSAFEQLRGTNVEFDQSRPSVKIEQNVLLLNYAVCASMIDTVNIAPLWGLPRRTIKLSNFSWERKYHGFCYKYFTRIFEFEINYRTWDRDLLDEGSKVLNGHWDFDTGEWILDPIDGVAPDRNNPSHFIRFKDKNGENTRVILNGFGEPALASVAFGGAFINVSNDPSLGDALNDSRNWLVLANADPAFWFEWDEEVDFYPRGTIVSIDEVDFYVSLVDIEGSQTPLDPLQNVWLPLDLGVTDQGEYDATVTYNRGDIVTDPGGTIGAGSVRVEKYPESNFLLLGIPLIF